MIFTATQLDDAWLIDLEPREDECGFFARIWCRQELAAKGLDPDIAQESLSFNRHRGTLRGLHFQRPPHEETKIVRCTRSGIFDVIVGLRPRSPSAQTQSDDSADPSETPRSIGAVSSQGGESFV
jgi:dTDP-4-dehydrorhamnose 3,5-epimerase